MVGRWWGAGKAACPRQLSVISPQRHTVWRGFQGPWLLATRHNRRADVSPARLGSRNLMISRKEIRLD